VGRNGLGKTTLLRILMGIQPPDAGTVTIGKSVHFNYVDQQRLILDSTRSLTEEIGGRSDFIQWGAEKLHVRSYLKRFLFSDDRVSQRVEVLSGGERSRLLLAKILCRGGNFIVLDEPTNDLDLATLRTLEEALLEFPGCVLVVSHDRYFLDRICDRVLVFEGDGRLHLQEGNYSYYLEKNRDRLAAARAAVSSMARAAAPVRPTPPREKRRRLTYKEERELEGIESRIMEMEVEIAALESLINDSAFYVTRASDAPAIIASLEAKKHAVHEIYARWEELETMKAANPGGCGHPRV
jgi:ATP-binding cassette subfamily F protein uup